MNKKNSTSQNVTRTTQFQWWIDLEISRYDLNELRRRRASGKTWRDIAAAKGIPGRATDMSSFYRGHYGKVTYRDLARWKLDYLPKLSRRPRCENWNQICQDAWSKLQTGDSPTNVAQFLRKSGWEVSLLTARERLNLWIKWVAELSWGEKAPGLLLKRKPKKRAKRGPGEEIGMKPHAITEEERRADALRTLLLLSDSQLTDLCKIPPENQTPAQKVLLEKINRAYRILEEYVPLKG